MPCDGSHMNATTRERDLSRVACLIDELDGKAIKREHWDGYHPRVYNEHLSDAQATKMVATLCGRLQKLDVTDYSLEMQMWWRDHQQADRDRIELELERLKTDAERDRALAKLTDYERELLGLD